MVSKPRLLSHVLPAFGLALVASLALSAIAASSAFAAVPKNTALPVVSPNPPQLGVSASTSLGTWTEKPTSYTYAWSRCNGAGGECAAIAGATKSTYTPTAADLGHTLVSSVTAYNASGNATASSKATGYVTATQYWYAGGTKLTEATPTGLTMSGLPGTYPNPSFTVQWSWGGPTFTPRCTSQTGEGTVENPAGALAGTATTSFTLGGCTLKEPAGQNCKITGGAITMGTLVGQASEFEGKSAVRFTPQSGGNLFSITLEGCKTTALNTTYNFTGSFTGVSNAANSSLEFSKASSAIAFGGEAATLEGASKVQTTGALALKVAP